MSGTVIRGGRYVSGPEVDYGYYGPSYQRANVFDSTSEALIVYRLGIWAGRRSGTVRLKLGIGAGGSSPGSLYAQTGELSVGTAYTDITGGTSVVGNVSPFVLPRGTFSLAALVTSGEMGHSMRAASSISASNRNFYDKGNTSGNITSPIGGSASYNGHMSIWFEAERNQAPNRPTGLTVSSNLSLTPTLGSSFSDPNETLNNGASYDYLNRYQVRIRRNSDGAYVVGTTTVTASGSERSNRKTAWTVPGGRLTYATTYTYEVRHEDRNGAWSAWASTTFSITSLSSVDRPTAPVGTLTTLTPSITAVYRSQSGVAANAVQARLLTASGAVIRTGPVVSRSVANNAATTLTWAQAGLGSLEWGDGYQVQVRARDTNGQWSPSWSPARSFRTNAAPATPTNLAPTGSKASSTRPMLTARASDPDGGTPTVYAEILSGGTVVATRTMTYAGSGTYRYQTTSADVASYGTFQWRAYSYDGTLYSGGTTSAASATRSTTATFIYAAVPEVTVTGPASPVETITPVVSWTTAAQSRYRVRAFDPATDALVYDSGEVVSTAGRAQALAPAGWYAPWKNGETINIIISVQASGIWGDSEAWPLTLEYTPPNPIGLEVFHHTLSGTSGPTAHRVVWDQTDIATEDFSHYELWRVELLDDGVTERPASRVNLLAGKGDDPLQTELLDAEVTSGQLYAYDIIQVAALGNDTVASDPTRVTSSISWDGLMLHCPADPEALHVQLRVGPPNDRYAPSMQLGQPHRLVSPVGQGARVAFFGRGQTADPAGTFGIIELDGMTADARKEALLTIWRAQGGEWDGKPKTVCWRDGRGGSLGRVYGMLAEPVITHGGARSYTVDLQMMELTFALGEGVDE